MKLPLPDRSSIYASLIVLSIIAGMAYFAVKRKVRLVAEGIETAAELKTLRSLGVHHGQGYLLGRPRDGRSPGPWPTSVALPAG